MKDTIVSAANIAGRTSGGMTKISSSSSSFAPSCPCCQFWPEDLFLPEPNERSSTNIDGEDVDVDVDDCVPSSQPKLSTFLLEKSHGTVDGEENPDTWPSSTDLVQVARTWLASPTTTTRDPPYWLVDTHGHAHLERDVTSDVYRADLGDPSDNSNAIRMDTPKQNTNTTTTTTRNRRPDHGMLSLSCAVEPFDWQRCLDHAAAAPTRVAGLGVHPWYLAGLDLTDHHHSEPIGNLDDTNHRDGSQNNTTTTQDDTNRETDTPPNESSLFSSNKDNDEWYHRLERLLQQHPGCWVGEIGLCDKARFVRTYPHGKSAALQLQRRIFQQQLELAARYGRPVSIHCVGQQSVLLQVLKEQQQKEQPQVTNEDHDGEDTTSHFLPPVIALHSFTGSAHHVQQLLAWEASLYKNNDRKKKKRGTTNDNPTSVATTAHDPLIYFGISHTVNCAMAASSSIKSRRRTRAAVRAIPRDRLLAESDVAASSEIAVGTAAAVAYLAWARNETLGDMAVVTARNGATVLRQWRLLQQQDAIAIV